MHITNVRIVNLRNFAELDVALAANVLMVGENRVGKSNFIFALRLVLDSSCQTLLDNSNSATFGMDVIWQHRHTSKWKLT